MTGKLDGLVYCHFTKTDQVYTRKDTPPKRNPSANRLRLIMANFKLINPSTAYRKNLTDYLYKYDKQHDKAGEAILNWSGIFLKIMFAMAKANPEIDLATLTREQIYASNLPCITLKDAVQAELIPYVRDWKKFTALI